jgi:hypothetical protein
MLTINADNMASRRVCLANGGVLEGRANGEDRFWITIGSGPDGAGRACAGNEENRAAESGPRPCAEALPPTD